MTGNDTRRGIWLMVATTFVFAMQDGISRHLAGEYNVLMVVMIRYWFFAAFVITVATRKAGGLRAAWRPGSPSSARLRQSTAMATARRAAATTFAPAPQGAYAIRIGAWTVGVAALAGVHNNQKKGATVGGIRSVASIPRPRTTTATRPSRPWTPYWP